MNEYREKQMRIMPAPVDGTAGSGHWLAAVLVATLRESGMTEREMTAWSREKKLSAATPMSYHQYLTALCQRWKLSAERICRTEESQTETERTTVMCKRRAALRGGGWVITARRTETGWSYELAWAQRDGEVLVRLPGGWQRRGMAQWQRETGPCWAVTPSFLRPQELSDDPVAVRWLQSRLNRKAGGKLPVDGIPTENIEALVRDYQRDNGLPETGRVQGETLKALARV